MAVIVLFALFVFFGQLEFAIRSMVTAVKGTDSFE